jgi:hypothetical protein
LKFYGINGDILKWITCFLTKRSQSVIVDGAKSEAVPVESGVPQGTVLGPLIFLLHMNDLPFHVTSTVRLFADDCLLYRCINSVEDQEALQKDLHNLQDWGTQWGMKFNATKCNVLRSHRGKNPLHKFYELSGCILEEVNFSKYLGVAITNDLTWTNHISQIVKKANSTLGFLRRNLSDCPSACKNTAYKAMIRSILEYGGIIWDPHIKKEVSILESIQKRSARFVFRDYRKCSSVTDMMKKLEWPSLAERRRKARLIFMFKIVKGLVAVTPSDIDLILATSATRKCNSMNFRIPSSRTNQHKYSFAQRTIPEWNKLPQHAVDKMTPEEFRSTMEEAH